MKKNQNRVWIKRVKTNNDKYSIMTSKMKKKQTRDDEKIGKKTIVMNWPIMLLC